MLSEEYNAASRRWKQSDVSMAMEAKHKPPILGFLPHKYSILSYPLRFFFFCFFLLIYTKSHSQMLKQTYCLVDPTSIALCNARVRSLAHAPHPPLSPLHPFFFLHFVQALGWEPPDIWRGWAFPATEETGWCFLVGEFVGR